MGRGRRCYIVVEPKSALDIVRIHRVSDQSVPRNHRVNLRGGKLDRAVRSGNVVDGKVLFDAGSQPEGIAGFAVRTAIQSWKRDVGEIAESGVAATAAGWPPGIASGTPLRTLHAGPSADNGRSGKGTD